MKKRTLMVIGMLSFLAASAAGCNGEQALNSGDTGQNNNEAAVTPVPARPAPGKASSSAAAIQVSPEPKAKSENLIPQAITDYDGSGRGFIVDGNEVKTEFRAHKELPLGLFVPETMLRLDINEAAGWGTADKRNYLTLVSAGKTTDLSKISGVDPALAKYREYAGSFADGDGTVDVFEFSAKGQAYLAEIRTIPGTRERMRPLFTDMIGNIQSMVKREPLVGGVFIQRKPAVSSKKDQQALQVALRCLKAIAEKDIKTFNSTLYSTQAAEGLSYWVDNDTTFRFVGLSYEGQPQDSRRRIFIVEYKTMTPEGYFSIRSAGMPLLLNKQGEWRVADID